MDESYVVVTVLIDKNTVDRACTALEEAGIPVLIELLRISDRELSNRRLMEREFESSSDVTSGYRILTPAHHSQKALRLLGLSTDQPTQEAA